MFRLMFPLLLLALLLSACGDSAEEANATPESCEETSKKCDAGKVMLCQDGRWAFLEDCESTGEICWDGQCEALNALYLQTVDANTSFSVNMVEGVEVFLAPLLFTEGNFKASYAITAESGDTEQATATRMRNIAPLQAGARHRYQRKPNALLFDEMQRERTKSVFKRFADDAMRQRLLEKIKWREAASERKSEACVLSAECADDALCHEGVCKKEIELYFSGWDIHERTRAKPVKKGERCAILLDTRDTGAISDAWLERFLRSCDDVIVKRNRSLFGDARFIIEGEETDLSDIDGDGLLHVFFSSLVNEENVWGFFSSADFYEDEPGLMSNERDIIYVLVPETEKEIPSIEATLIHEYQHVLHFAIHTWRAYLTGESDPPYAPVWLDEAFAHLAEEVGGYGADNLWLVQDYLSAINDVSLTGGSDTLDRRAMGMLFMLYLFERMGGVTYNNDGSIQDKGGAAFLQAILKSPKDGMASLRQEAETKLGYPIETLFFHWMATLIADKTGKTNDPTFQYPPIFLDPVTGNEIGIVTHGERIGQNGESYLFDGPRAYEITGGQFNETLYPFTAQFIRLSSIESSLDLHFKTESMMGLGVIRLGGIK